MNKNNNKISPVQSLPVTNYNWQGCKSEIENIDIDLKMIRKLSKGGIVEHQLESKTARYMLRYTEYKELNYFVWVNRKWLSSQLAESKRILIIDAEKIMKMQSNKKPDIKPGNIGMANIIAQSALFSPVRKRSEFKNELLCKSGNEEIRFTGEALGQFDLDIMNVLSDLIENPLFSSAEHDIKTGKIGSLIVNIKKPELLRACSLSKGGKTWESVDKSLTRLMRGLIHYKNKKPVVSVYGPLVNECRECKGTLISYYSYNRSNAKLSIKLSAVYAQLFCFSGHTSILNIRKELKGDFTKALFHFVACEIAVKEGPHTINIEHLMRLFKSSKEVEGDFIKRKLKPAMEILSGFGVLSYYVYSSKKRSIEFF